MQTPITPFSGLGPATGTNPSRKQENPELAGLKQVPADTAKKTAGTVLRLTSAVKGVFSPTDVRSSEAVNGQTPTFSGGGAHAADAEARPDILALSKKVPLLKSFLDTFPKKGLVGHFYNTPGVVAYLETISQPEKIAIVTHYKELAPLFDAKITESGKKKDSLTAAFCKVLIEGCISNAHPASMNLPIHSLSLSDLLKLTHTQNGELRRHGVTIELINSQLGCLPTQAAKFTMVTIENLEANLRTLFSPAGGGGAAAEADFDATNGAGGGAEAVAPSAPPREHDEEDTQVAAAIAASLKTKSKLSPAGGGAEAVAPSAPPREHDEEDRQIAAAIAASNDQVGKDRNAHNLRAKDPDLIAAIAASNDQVGKDRNAHNLRAKHRAIVRNDEMAAQQVALALSLPPKGGPEISKKEI